MRQKLRKIRQVKIPLYWVKTDRPDTKRHIGYFYPERNSIATTNGNFSSLTRPSLDGRTTVPENKMHLRREVAAYRTEDFTYYGD